MIVAQVLVVLLVGVSGTLVVVTRDTVHQVLVFGLFGLILALAFLLLQAPDAALAQLVVSGLVMPLLVVVVLAELRGRTR
jgi:energy-converting hydrogenase B subunit D